MSRLELKDTVELMGSSDYRDSFVAEYIQLKIRYEKLKAFNTRIEAARRTAGEDNGVDEPIHDCPAGLLREQQAAMGEYLHLLEVRAVIEDIDLADAEMWLERKKDTSSTADAVPLPQGEGLTEEELRISLEGFEDDWDVVSEAVCRVIEKGLCEDSDEEKLMAAALNVLHKIKLLDEPCRGEKSVETRCDKCVHLPICEYCSVHLKGFMLPAKPNECDMYLRIKEI